MAGRVRFAIVQVLTSALRKEATSQFDAPSIRPTDLLTVGGLRMVVSCNAKWTWPEFAEVEISEQCEIT